MKKIFTILLILCCMLPAMAKKRQNEEIITPLTQLEKRQFQTKTYPASDNLIAMKAILNVLQDEGFIVYNVNSLLGYIYGVKDFDTSDPNVDISKEFGLTKSRLSYNGVKVATLEVSTNVTQYGEQARIRINFKRKLFNEYGNAQMIEDIDDAEFYSDFYQKVDAAIALQKEIARKTKKVEVQVSQKQKVKPPVRKPQIQQVKPVTEQENKDIPKETATQESNIAETDKKTSEENIKTEENVQTEKKSTADENIDENKNIQANTEIKPKNQPEISEQNSSEKENIPKEGAVPESVYTSEQILELVPVDTEPEHIKTPKEEARELKELVKQAKAEAKQAEKEAKQAQKEALKLQKDLDKQARKVQKEAQKEAKRQAKEMQE